MGSLLPDLIIALDQVAVDRPAEPCKVIAQELLAAAQQMQAGHSDPYNAPVYDIQLAKVQAKAEREAARAAAAAAKAARCAVVGFGRDHCAMVDRLTALVLLRAQGAHHQGGAGSCCGC
jgi:hypothetical protein